MCCPFSWNPHCLHRFVHIFFTWVGDAFGRREQSTLVFEVRLKKSVNFSKQILGLLPTACSCADSSSVVADVTFLQEFCTSAGHIRQQRNTPVPWSGTSTYDKPVNWALIFPWRPESVAFIKLWVGTRTWWQEGLQKMYEENQKHIVSVGVFTNNPKRGRREFRAATLKTIWEH